MDTIAIVGAKGSMGRRYSAILKQYNPVLIDIDNQDLLDKKYSYVIIASPTDKHLNHIDQCLKAGSTNILCEKPIFTDLNWDFPENVRMVSNWRYLFMPEKVLSPNSHSISYKYFNWGKNNDVWDILQPIYLSFNLITGTDPIFYCKIDNKMVLRERFDYSYILMIKDWLHHNQYTFTMSEAKEAIQKCLEY